MQCTVPKNLLFLTFYNNSSAMRG